MAAKKRGAPKRAAKQVSRAERHAKALDMRRSGMTYAQIGAKLGIAMQSAHELVQVALKSMVREPGEDVIELERQRLDAALKAVWARVGKGNMGAIDVMLKVMARRAKLDGLDKGKDDVTIGLSVSSEGPDTSRWSPAKLHTYFALMAEAARTPGDRERYEQAAAALLPRGEQVESAGES